MILGSIATVDFSEGAVARTFGESTSDLFVSHHNTRVAPIHSRAQQAPSPNFTMVFRDLADCRAQCVQAGREWDLSVNMLTHEEKLLNAQEVAWLADVLADPQVWCIPD